MKKTAAFTLALILAFSLFAAMPAAADAGDAETAADALHSLGLFQGTGEGYELDRAPTKAEALVMLVRLLGSENEAKAFDGACPLTDVTGRWMAPYVGWAYEEGLTKGVSEDAFDPDSTASAQMYAAFVLRALGYREDQGDFSYSDALTVAAEKGIAPAGETEFLRSDAVIMSWQALSADCRDGGLSLIQKLAGDGAVDPETAVSLGFPVTVSEPEPPFEGLTYTVCCAGDSLTFGLMSDDPATQSYPSVMADMTEGGIRFVTENYGLSGACVDPDDSYMFALPYTASAEYAGSVETQAEIVLVMLGTNDAFWSPNRDVFEENFTALLRTYIDLAQAPQVIVVLPPHIFFEMGGIDYNDNLEELLVKERAVAETLGLPVIDAHSFNEGQSEMFVDGIHFTVEGYELLADTIYTQLCEILNG